jgi:carbonic anhydrase
MSLKARSLVRLEGRKSRQYYTGKNETNKNASLEDSIKEDLTILRKSSWIKKNTRLIGLKYNTHTGVLDEVQDLKPQL